MSTSCVIVFQFNLMNNLLCSFLLQMYNKFSVIVNRWWKNYPVWEKKWHVRREKTSSSRYVSEFLGGTFTIFSYFKSFFAHERTDCVNWDSEDPTVVIVEKYRLFSADAGFLYWTGSLFFEFFLFLNNFMMIHSNFIWKYIWKGSDVRVLVKNWFPDQGIEEEKNVKPRRWL